MKKILIFLMLVISSIAASATSYRVKYDVINQRSTSFIVKVEPNRLTIGSNVYTLRQMGTITNSGLLFNSYTYGSGYYGRLAISTTSITVEKNRFLKLAGYVIIINNKAYLADKICQ